MSMNLNVAVKGIKRGMNIMDVKVPAKLREKHPSGLEWLDDALGGEGFTPGTVTMFTGTPGAGKTTGLLQLADALTGLGHEALLNTGEESLYQVKLVTERLKLKNGFVPGQDTVIPDVLAHCNHIMRTRMAKHLDGVNAYTVQPPACAPKGTKPFHVDRLKVGSKQLFLLVDSLQCMDDGKYRDGGTTGATPQRVVEMLTDFAKATFVNVIFIGQVNKSGEFSGKNGIKHAIDTHAHLYIDQDKRSDFYGERMFAINKNRFGCSGRTYVMGMNDRGLYEMGRFHTADLKKKEAA